ncbi:MAG: 50S ribosomal protein L24 [Clostridia bacterium]
MNIKKGDKVAIICGKDKGKIGNILEVSRKDEKVVVESVNIVSRHTKPKSAQDKGGIIKKAAPVDASNVIVICPVCGKATRVAHKEVDGKKARVCKKCGACLDQKMVKTVKKEVKKVNKEVAKPAEKTKNVSAAKTVEKSTKITAKTAAAKSAVKQVKTIVRKTSEN